MSEPTHVPLSQPADVMTLPPLSRRGALKTAAKGTGILLVGRIFTYIARLAMTVLLTRFLGAEQYGLYTLSLVAAQVAGSVGVLGFDSALVRYIAIYRSRGDQARLWGTLQIGAFGGIVGVVCGVVVFGLSDYLALEVFHDARLAPLFRISSALVPFLTLTSLISAATRGFRNMQYTVIAQQFSQPMLRMILLIGIALTIGLTPALATIAYSISAVTATILLVYFLNKQFSLRRRWSEGRRETREILLFCYPVYISDMLREFGANIQSLLLGALYTVKSVGVYTAAAHFNLLGQLFHSSISQASMPILSELYDRKRWKELGRYYQTTTKWSVALNLPLFLVVLLFPAPILSLFGRGFQEGVAVLIILAWVNVAHTSTGLCGAIIDMTGHTRLKLVNTVGLVTSSVGLNLLLVPSMGMYGAAWAALISAVLVNSARLVEVYVLFRLLPYNWEILKPLAAGVGASLIGWVIYGAINPSLGIYPAFGASVVALTGTYAGLIVLFGLEADDREILRGFRHRLGGLRSSARDRKRGEDDKEDPIGHQ